MGLMNKADKYYNDNLRKHYETQRLRPELKKYYGFTNHRTVLWLPQEKKVFYGGMNGILVMIQ
jgi:hypothetical protein